MAKTQQIPSPSNTVDFKGFPSLCAVLGQKLNTYGTGDLAFYCTFCLKEYLILSWFQLY